MAKTDFNNRFVGLKEESSYGTKATGTYTFGEVDDESIRHQFDLLNRDDMSRYGAAKSVNGKEFSEGDFNLALLNDDFTGYLIAGLMGTDTVSGSSPKVHTFTEAGTLTSYTFMVGRQEQEHFYTGGVVNSMSVSAALNEYATISFGVMAKAEDNADLQTVGTTTPTFPDSLPALYFSNAKVFFNGNGTASDAVRSISFDINLNRDGDNACGLGSTTYIRAPPIQRREISGTIEFNRVLTTTTNGAPSYDDLIDEDGEEFAGSGVELKVQFGDDSTADLLTFNFYKIRFEAPEANVSGRDTQTLSVGFTALFSPDDSKMMDIVMKNSQATSYTA